MAFDPEKVKRLSRPSEAIPRDVDGNLAFRRELREWIHYHGECGYGERSVLEWCRNDVLFFADALVYTLDPIRHLGRGLRPWISLPFQREEMIPAMWQAMGDPFPPSNDDVIQRGYPMTLVKDRDRGASWSALICAACRFLCFDWTNGCLVSLNYDLLDDRRNPNSLFPKLDVMFSRMPSFFLVGVERTKAKFTRSVVKADGETTMAILDGLPNTEYGTRGSRPDFSFQDEFQAWDETIASEFAGSAVGATNCRLYMGTAGVSGSAFHRMVKNPDIPNLTLKWETHPWHAEGLYRAENGKEALLDGEFWGRTTLRWLRRSYPLLARKIPKDWSDDAPLRECYPFVKTALPPRGTWDGVTRSPWHDSFESQYVSSWQMGREVYCEFTGKGTNTYDHAKFDVLKEGCVPCFSKGELRVNESTLKPERFVESEDGRLRLWVNLVSGVNGDFRPPRGRYALGVDVSAGTGASNSGIVGWDVGRSTVALVYRNPNIKPHELADLANSLGHWFYGAKIIAEGRQGHGLTFSDRLSELGYPGQYKMRRKDKKHNGGVEFEPRPGFFTTQNSKDQLLNDLGQALVRGEGSILDSETLDEAYSFQVGTDSHSFHAASSNKSDPGGAKANHGDCWMAAAMGWFLVCDMGGGVPMIRRARTPARDMEQAMDTDERRGRSRKWWW